jgi:hypothetical protein
MNRCRQISSWLDSDHLTRIEFGGPERRAYLNTEGGGVVAAKFNLMDSDEGELWGLYFTLLGHHTAGSIALFDPVSDCFFLWGPHLFLW